MAGRKKEALMTFDKTEKNGNLIKKLIWKLLCKPLKFCVIFENQMPLTASN